MHTPLRLAPPALLSFALVVLGAAAPAQAQRMMRDRGDEAHRGLYFALGGGLGLQMPSPGTGLTANYADNALGYLGEVRLGYSLARSFQLFLSVDAGGSSQPAGFLQVTNFLAAMRYFIWADESVGVYFRGGLGIGLVSYNDYASAPGAPTTGLAEAGGLGMEIRLDKKWSLSPEVFYRRTNESSVYRADMVGMAILVNFN